MKMSTAFMVDSILQDKEDQTHDSYSSALDTDSDQNSDHKDSVCDSPPPNYHHHRHNSGPDELLQSYAVLRNRQTMNRNSLMDNDMGSNDGSGCGDSDGGSGGGVDVGSNDGGSGGGCIIELCCAKCGHFQIGNNKTIIDNEIQYNFKCDKCGCGDYLHPKETIITKDSVNSVKPVLKFSVSAILGDRNDCGKVRNGE